MSRYDPTAIAAAKRSRARLVDTIASYGGRVESDGKVHCPNRSVHENGDRNPSATIGAGESGDYLIRCHAPACDLAGSVFDLVMRLDDCGFTEAAEKILGSDAPIAKGNGSKHRDAKPKPRPKPPESELENARKFADDCHSRLMADADALEHLWKTRGVNRATAERFRVGITDDEPGGRFWVFPIVTPAGVFIGAKSHRADGQGQKSLWRPKGVAREQVWPVSLEPSGPVWLCPGELKALAAISNGCAAFGITSGEGGDLPADALPLLAGRTVALPFDNDTDGRAWADKFQQQLADAGIESRAVPMGEHVHEPKADVGDWIVRLIEDGKGADAIRASLEHGYELADPWGPYTLSTIWHTPRTWQVVEHVPSGLRDFDQALGGGLRTRAAHLLVGRSGKAKTQIAMQVASNAALADYPVGILSLELARDEVGQLLAAQLGCIPRNRIARGELSEPDVQRLQETIRDFERLPIAILDDEYWPGGLDRNRLDRVVAAGCKRFGWRLVVCDYMGLLAGVETDRTDYQSDLLNSTTIRRISRQNDIAFVVVAALRKSGTMKKTKDISLDDVLGAGRLAYDATSVTLVDSEQEHGSPGHPRGTVTLRILKSRFSATFREPLTLTWHPGFGRIEDQRVSE